MNPAQYVKFFTREARMILLMGCPIGLIVAGTLGASSAPKPIHMLVLLQLFFPMFLGVALGRNVLALETRATCLLLPGLRQGLWAWNAAMVLALSLVWGLLVHAAASEIPMAVAVALSAAISTAPLALHRQRPRWMLIGPFWLGLMAAQLGLINGDWPAVVPFVSAHAVPIAVLSLAVAAWQLWMARDWTRVRRLQLVLRDESDLTMNAESGALFAKLGRWGNASDLGHRRGSLRTWVQAVHQESPGISHAKGLTVTGLVLVLAFPLLRDSGGYPLAWYRLVFGWGEGPGPMLSVLLWMGLIAAGLVAPLPRRDVLYPIPRRRRAQMAFWSSAGTWVAMLGVWMGGAMLLALLTGWWLKQPLPARALVRFAAPATLSLLILPILRGAALHWEGKSDMAMWVTVIVTIPLAIAGWIAFSVVPPLTSLLLVGLTTGLGLGGYYVLLQDYFTKEDLIQPQPAKPITVV
jgi:hypothetical protein